MWKKHGSPPLRPSRIFEKHGSVRLASCFFFTFLKVSCFFFQHVWQYFHSTEATPASLLNRMNRSSSRNIISRLMKPHLIQSPNIWSIVWVSGLQHNEENTNSHTADRREEFNTESCRDIFSLPTRAGSFPWDCMTEAKERQRLPWPVSMWYTKDPNIQKSMRYIMYLNRDFLKSRRSEKSTFSGHGTALIVVVCRKQ